jgi:DNA-binding MurR/RpiR family transcriptional regulator
MTAKFRFKTKDVVYTKKEQKIIDYIYQNISIIPFMSIGQLSEKIGISVATISRFVRHAGFKDFKELKTDIAGQNSFESPAEKMNETLSVTDNTDFLELLRYQQFCISKTIELLSKSEIKKAVNKLAVGSSTIIVLTILNSKSVMLRTNQIHVKRK